MILRQPLRPATQRAYGAAQPSPRPRATPSVHRDRDAQNRPAPDVHAWAKHLMTLGFKVVPLAPTKLDVDRSGKYPMTEHGVHDATNDFAAFRRLVGSATNFNIGVATGSASGVVVIDVDPRNGGDRACAELKRRLGPVPRTLTCDTGGGGWHYYFRLPPGVEMKKKVLAPGVDLLAEGTYAVAPPSLHSSGRRYRWAEHRGPGNRRSRRCPTHGSRSSPATVRRGMSRLRLTARRSPKGRGTPS